MVLISWQLGFFYRFNYLTAQVDKFRDKARVVILDVPQLVSADPIAYNSLNEKFGFHLYYDDNITSEELRGINMYNSEIERFLEKRNGKGWRKKYQLALKNLEFNYKH